jgi:DNA processing protein
MSFFERDQDPEISEDELAHWLAFSHMSGPGIGYNKLKSLLDRFENVSEIWKASPSHLKNLQLLSDETIEKFVKTRSEIDPLNLLALVRKSHTLALHFFHPLYPASLRHIADPPLVLYVKGQLDPMQIERSIAVVGTRRPTNYGQRLAKSISKELAQAGVLIISGMAVGIDSLAHWGAIEGDGKTIAVLGCGVDICYPSSNKPLYRAILEDGLGALVSEYLPGTKPQTWHFPARNRIISGISAGVLVVEAGQSSGSLITAEMAFDQARNIYAIPGRIDAPMSIGTNNLIARTKAQLVTNATDILREQNWLTTTHAGTTTPTIVQLFGREREIYDLISSEPVHFDYLLEKTGMNSGELSATLTMLELAGVVSRLPGDWYARLEAIASF